MEMRCGVAKYLTRKPRVKKEGNKRNSFSTEKQHGKATSPTGFPVPQDGDHMPKS